jgi:hypothetical protein
MNKFVSALCAGSLSLTFGLVPAIPSVAAPMVSQANPFSNVQTVQYRDEWRKRNRNHRVNRDHNRRGHWNGYRGERNKRHGYRRHNDGLWYPLAAFGLGAIIGGAIANQPQPAPVYRERRGGNAHVQWCYGQYRSYRASDNTFQPYNGPRQQCYSPY